MAGDLSHLLTIVAGTVMDWHKSRSVVYTLSLCQAFTQAFVDSCYFLSRTAHAAGQSYLVGHHEKPVSLTWWVTMRSQSYLVGHHEKSVSLTWWVTMRSWSVLLGGSPWEAGQSYLVGHHEKSVLLGGSPWEAGQSYLVGHHEKPVSLIWWHEKQQIPRTVFHAAQTFWPDQIVLEWFTTNLMISQLPLPFYEYSLEESAFNRLSSSLPRLDGKA